MTQTDARHGERDEQADVIIIGAGAAGLMAAIHAGRSGRGGRVIAVDGARRLGAKILVAGGGRCNVTHDVVDESAFAGSSRKAVRKVLRRFDVPQTVEFFRGLGVHLKREETGKLFPTTDRAQTVLSALLDECRRVGVAIRHPWRVIAVRRAADGSFIVESAGDAIRARRIVMATGGKSLPKTGSDGFGYEIVRSLGHTITPRVFPGLVPLTLPKDHFLCALSGITLPAALEVRDGRGRKIAEFTDSTLLTHFGLSGPSVLDISRYLIDALLDNPEAQLLINFLPGERFETLEALLSGARRSTVAGTLAGRLPERLIRALCELSDVEPARPIDQIPRERRRALVHSIVQLTLPVTGDRGYTFAEVTAGGVPLREIVLETMESRVCPGLFICGEICDVDGRIGGYNFQWAWASGYVAGVSVAGPDDSR